MERELDEFIRQNPVLQEKEDLLKVTPGIGDQTTRTLLADLPELGSLVREQIASLAGVAPLNHDSGLFQEQRRICGLCIWPALAP